MLFVDKVKLEIKAGNGGNGAISFHREKYVDKGGPAGGDGGRGGSIYFTSDSGLTTLLDIKYRRIIEAKSGENGGKNNMYGRSAEDIYVKVPVGTVVTNLDDNRIIADFKKPNETKLIAKGGRGGRGNAKFCNSVNQVPKVAENGEPGEDFNASVELKLLADVGLVGLPSVGKSSIISCVSACKPEIASYHFTTLIPNLGVVRSGDDSFVMADLPGLIEGASQGKGLGLQFLRHIERCKVLIHVVDMGQEEGRDALEDFRVINKELEKYKTILLNKPMIVAANKMDVDGAKENLERFKKEFKDYDIFPISSLTHSGLDALIFKANEIVKKEKESALLSEEDIQTSHVYKIKEKDKGYIITHPSLHLWVVSGERIEKLYRMTNITDDEGFMYLISVMRKMGIDDELTELGAVDGDTIKLCDLEMDYFS